MLLNIMKLSFISSFLVGCSPPQNNDGFGIASSVSDQAIDTATNTEGGEETSTDDTVNEDGPESPFSVDSSSVCGDRIVGTSIGDCAVNFTLGDRESEMIDLHSFAGDVIFLDLSSFG